MRVGLSYDLLRLSLCSLDLCYCTFLLFPTFYNWGSFQQRDCGHASILSMPYTYTFLKNPHLQFHLQSTSRRRSFYECLMTSNWCSRLATGITFSFVVMSRSPRSSRPRAVSKSHIDEAERKTVLAFCSFEVLQI